MFCNQCGAKQTDVAKFCSVCGSEIIKPNEAAAARLIVVGGDCRSEASGQSPKRQPVADTAAAEMAPAVGAPDAEHKLNAILSGLRWGVFFPAGVLAGAFCCIGFFAIGSAIVGNYAVPSAITTVIAMSSFVYASVASGLWVAPKPIPAVKWVLLTFFIVYLLVLVAGMDAQGLNVFSSLSAAAHQKMSILGLLIGIGMAASKDPNEIKL